MAVEIQCSYTRIVSFYRQKPLSKASGLGHRRRVLLLLCTRLTMSTKYWGVKVDFGFLVRRLHLLPYFKAEEESCQREKQTKRRSEPVVPAVMQYKCLIKVTICPYSLNSKECN